MPKKAVTTGVSQVVQALYALLRAYKTPIADDAPPPPAQYTDGELKVLSEEEQQRVFGNVCGHIDHQCFGVGAVVFETLTAVMARTLLANLFASALIRQRLPSWSRTLHGRTRA
jgi:hypothetical protein